MCPLETYLMVIFTHLWEVFWLVSFVHCCRWWFQWWWMQVLSLWYPWLVMCLFLQTFWSCTLIFSQVLSMDLVNERMQKDQYYKGKLNQNISKNYWDIFSTFFFSEITSFSNIIHTYIKLIQTCSLHWQWKTEKVAFLHIIFIRWCFTTFLVSHQFNLG